MRYHWVRLGGKCETLSAKLNKLRVSVQRTDGRLLASVWVLLVHVIESTDLLAIPLEYKELFDHVSGLLSMLRC